VRHSRLDALLRLSGLLVLVHNNAQRQGFKYQFVLEHALILLCFLTAKLRLHYRSTDLKQYHMECDIYSRSSDLDLNRFGNCDYV
jgi:hypothetical protein